MKGDYAKVEYFTAIIIGNGDDRPVGIEGYQLSPGLRVSRLGTGG